jgi:hypothetical protein
MNTTQAQTSGTASDSRVRLYVNGSQVTALSISTMPAQNATPNANTSALSHVIGARSSGVLHLDGYLSEVYFIDGQALTPSSFGETNSDGVWVPKKYTGTYGTNGFYLPFDSTTNVPSLAIDKKVGDVRYLRSGNGDWTVPTYATKIVVECWGGGGGGGGVGPSSGTAGGNGTPTTFSTLSANGATGGGGAVTASPTGAAGAAGTASGGDVNTTGNPGLIGNTSSGTSGGMPLLSSGVRAVTPATTNTSTLVTSKGAVQVVEPTVVKLVTVN